MGGIAVRYLLAWLLVQGFQGTGCTTAAAVTPDEKILYRKVNKHKLYLHMFYPKNKKSNSRVPAAIFFFAGGWSSGKPKQFYPQAQHLADKGMLGISAEYRIRNIHKTTPFDALEDAKSAIRFVRKNAKKLGIDPKKIIAGGASSGGHLAAAAGTVSGYNAKGDDLSISAVPNALVLFNPVYDNSPNGYAYGRIGEAYKKFSPLHNISPKMPPAIVMLGTEDGIIPVSTAEKFQSLMRKAGVQSKLRIYQGQPHGFFNYHRSKKYYNLTVKEMDSFLRGLGLMAS
jgi:acetyl esterase/lipase